MEQALPTLAELTEDTETAYKQDKFNLLLSHEPPEKWVKNHPTITQDSLDDKGNKIKVPYRYLPIDKIEHLLKRIFKRFRIEITGQGESAFGVHVTVRVHYWSPTINDWDYHDGIGATHFLKSGRSAKPMDGALSMAFPLAKTLAIKDACDHFGNLFGANLNRRDTVSFQVDQNLNPNEIPAHVKKQISKASLEEIPEIYKEHSIYGSNPEFMRLLTTRKSELTK